MHSTPEKKDATEAIIESLTGMRLDWRRGLETSTIEGSPMMLHIRKKIDQKSTPFSIRDDVVSAVSVENEYGGGVLVMTCGSNIHDTKGHQENMIRTTLISGIDGCLRRESFKNIVLWEEYVGEACMADILR